MTATEAALEDVKVSAAAKIIAAKVQLAILVLVAVAVPTVWSVTGSSATDSVVDQTAARLEVEEGFRAKPYLDSRGILTIGFGTNIGEGITRREGEYLLRERLGATYETLFKELPWLSAAPERQQSALLDLGYQVGVHGLLGFHMMLGALRADDCPAAKRAALDSDWARETPERAERVTAILCED